MDDCAAAAVFRPANADLIGDRAAIRKWPLLRNLRNTRLARTTLGTPAWPDRIAGHRRQRARALP